MDNQTVEVANHTWSFQSNPPITELITITIATTSSKKSCGITKVEEYFT